MCVCVCVCVVVVVVVIIVIVVSIAETKKSNGYKRKIIDVWLLIRNIVICFIVRLSYCQSLFNSVFVKIK